MGNSAGNTNISAGVWQRRAMGIELAALRYRWAAMNPPAAFDDAGDLDDAYLGSHQGKSLLEDA